jgi:hypothetical protein
MRLCAASDLHRTPVLAACLGRMSDQNCLASLRGGPTISPAGYKRQFLPLGSCALEEKISRACACDSTVISGYLLASRADQHMHIRHWFAHYSGSC